jgi:hypothetical protein
MEKSWRKALSDGVVSGSAASVISTAALAARGVRENGTPYGPTNAISHWIWGDRAAAHDEPSARFTLLGYAIHHSASTLWATIYEKWFGETAEKKGAAPALVSAAAVAALACFVDYKMTPHRLQPGYEMRLSKKSLMTVYAAFGLGLSLRGLLKRAGGSR